MPVVPEEPEQPPEVQEPEPRVEQPAAAVTDMDITRGSDVVPNITNDAINVTEVVPNLEQPMIIPEMDISIPVIPQDQAPRDIQPMDVQVEGTSILEMPTTQVLQSLGSQNTAIKRPSEQDRRPAKKLRPSGSSGTSNNEEENIPPEDAQRGPAPAQAPSQTAIVSATFQHDAGILDIPTRRTNGEQATVSQEQVPGGSNETPLGSPDHGPWTESESERFLRTEWSLKGTMSKIIQALRRGNPVTVHELVKNGPIKPGLHRLIAAKCFVSIHKLKQKGFITISKNPETSEIVNITLGPKFN